MQECYIPEESRSIHHLNAKALRIVDLKTLDTQALLNSTNSALAFAQKRSNFSATIFFVELSFQVAHTLHYLDNIAGAQKGRAFLYSTFFSI